MRGFGLYQVKCLAARFFGLKIKFFIDKVLDGGYDKSHNK
jgi:hypothetical protein